MVGPDTDTVLVVVGQTGRTLVPGGLAVPARVEDATVAGVWEEAIQSRTMWRRDGRLDVGSIGAAVHRERVGAVLASGVRIVEHEPIAAELQGGRSVVASPVLVAGLVVAEVAERVWTVIGLAGAGGYGGRGGLGLAGGVDGRLLALLLVAVRARRMALELHVGRMATR